MTINVVSGFMHEQGASVAWYDRYGTANKHTPGNHMYGKAVFRFSHYKLDVKHYTHAYPGP